MAKTAKKSLTDRKEIFIERMAKRQYRKKRLLEALAKAGLPHTMPNFIEKYERKLCEKADCPLFGKPYLVSPRGKANKAGDSPRLYTIGQINMIVRTAKAGWFKRHWHWPNA